VLSVKQDRLIALSPPFGQRGRFFDERTGTGPWQRVKGMPAHHRAVRR
jgi:hypothetical protein